MQLPQLTNEEYFHLLSKGKIVRNLDLCEKKYKDSNFQKWYSSKATTFLEFDTFFRFLFDYKDMEFESGALSIFFGGDVIEDIEFRFYECTLKNRYLVEKVGAKNANEINFVPDSLKLLFYITEDQDDAIELELSFFFDGRSYQTTDLSKTLMELFQADDYNLIEGEAMILLNNKLYSEYDIYISWVEMKITFVLKSDERIDFHYPFLLGFV